jgi:hypothetical protein
MFSLTRYRSESQKEVGTALLDAANARVVGRATTIHVGARRQNPAQLSQRNIPYGQGSNLMPQEHLPEFPSSRPLAAGHKKGLPARDAALLSSRTYPATM